MEYDFYTLGVLYLVYSFAGWVGETVVATVRGKHFANRGAAAGCDSRSGTKCGGESRNLVIQCSPKRSKSLILFSFREVIIT